MYGLEDSPRWRTKSVSNGYLSNWDSEWYYHFSVGGFKDIEWLEIRVETEQQSLEVLSILKSIHVPGIKTEFGFKVFGYVKDRDSADYL